MYCVRAIFGRFCAVWWFEWREYLRDLARCYCLLPPKALKYTVVFNCLTVCRNNPVEYLPIQYITATWHQASISWGDAGAGRGHVE